MPVERVLINEDVVDGLLTYSKMSHPREGILLIRGKSKKGIVEVQSLVIPPAAIHGEGFSSFGWNMLPIDLSYIGVAHSHPSGHAVPSHQDVLHASGRIMIIVGYPYSDEKCLGVFDTDGVAVPFEVKKAKKKTE